MKILYFICAGLSFFALIDLPYGYYTFLRIAITFTAVYGLIKEYSGNIDFWIITLGIIAVLFNPIIPIHIGDKSIWKVINIACGILFVIKGVSYKNKKAK